MPFPTIVPSRIQGDLAVLQACLYRSMVATLGTITLLCWVTPAQAQVMRMQMPRFILLMDPAVQKELKLTDEQNKKVKEETADLYQEGPDGSKQLMIGPGQDLDEIDQRIEKHLKPEQIKRLNELHLQRMGYRGLTLPRVAKELKIGGDQEAKIESIMEEYQRKLMEKVQEQQQEGGVIRVTPEMMAEHDRELAKELEKVLTADQKKKWEEMQGAKFTFTKRPAPKK
jgi:Spy/CpxP family protein refolding chaperone